MDTVGYITTEKSPYASEFDPNWKDFNLIEVQDVPKVTIPPYDSGEVSGSHSAAAVPTPVPGYDLVIVTTCICDESIPKMITWGDYRDIQLNGDWDYSEAISDKYRISDLVDTSGEMKTDSWDKWHALCDYYNEHAGDTQPTTFFTSLKAAVAGKLKDQYSTLAATAVDIIKYKADEFKAKCEGEFNRVKLVTPGQGECVFDLIKRASAGADDHTVFICITTSTEDVVYYASDAAFSTDAGTRSGKSGQIAQKFVDKLGAGYAYSISYDGFVGINYMGVIIEAPIRVLSGNEENLIKAIKEVME